MNDLISHNSSDLDPVNNSNPNCWTNGDVGQCPYVPTCGNDGLYNLMFTLDQIAMHPNYDPENPDALGLGLFNSSENTGNIAKSNCWGGNASPPEYQNEWLGSQISSLHDDFPGFSGRPGYMYGMFEIRCKLPPTRNSYSSFWLSGNWWPPEIDVFEICDYGAPGDHNKFFSSVHWDTGSAVVQNMYEYDALNTYDLYSDLHTQLAI